MNRRQSGVIGITFVIAIAVVLAVGWYVVQRIDASQSDQSLDNSVQSIVPTKKPFVFTAAGDFGNDQNADLVLRGIASELSDFTLALGDLGYVGNGNEAAWCKFVKERLGQNHPFQLIAGNHDDGRKDGDITAYTACLPNKMDDVVGDYGTNYYFDYHQLARFIMISPDIETYGQDFTKGSPALEWVTTAAKDAKEKDIDWLILGMHKNCITPGVKTCEIGADLLNAALENDIDIVLQGHEHAYFRSKQLALSDACPAIVVDQYNDACVVSGDSPFKKSQGSLIVISGAGGYPMREVNLADPEIGYFAALNGTNAGNSFGYNKFTVSKEKIEAAFVPVTGSFTDAFTIEK